MVQEHGLRAILGGEVVLEFVVDEAVAIADALEAAMDEWQCHFWPYVSAIRY